MVLTTIVSTARTGTKSVRVTIPEGIADFLEIEVGDKLDWKMDVANGERVVIVKKAKKE